MAQTKAGRNRHSYQHSFAQVPSVKTPRSAFNRSHGVKTTFDSGYLIPIFADEALPGDTMSMSVSTFARMATPLHPVMDNMYLDLFFFAVPIRLIWNNFQKFMGEQDDPGDSTDFLVPTMSAPVGGHAAESLSDYLGIPTGITGLEHSSLWHRAYSLIWKEWFRSQDLQDSPVVDKDDGPDTAADYPLRRRGKRHDYFTSCLPWPQKGAAVTLPLGTEADIVGEARVRSEALTPTFFPSTGGGNAPLSIEQNQGTNWEVHFQASGQADNLRWFEPNLYADLESGRVTGGDPPYVDLSTATAATINELRQAFQIQRLYERDARAGTRYTEVIRSHFGVISPDARLNRPEYLGGSSTPIQVNPVPQTSTTNAEPSPKGSLAAFVTSAANSRGFIKSFTEHCVVLGLACVRADLNYQQGLPRMFSRSTRFDFFWPSLAMIGEQAVLSKEIYADGTSGDDDVFGYQERYGEYRYKPSLITGKFRSQYAQSLDTWHLAQDFAARPNLNATFIEENPPIERAVVQQDEPEFLFDAQFHLRHVRPMPVFGVPGMIDHF